jgi:hypothetical protein
MKFCNPLSTKITHYVFAILLLVSLASCTKKRRDTPQLPNYYIGKWEVEELYYFSGGARVDYTNVKGKINFDNGAPKSFHYDGDFTLTYASSANSTDPNNMHEDDISWRIDGLNLLVLTEDDENVIPTLGIGNPGMASFRPELFKEDFIVLSTLPLNGARQYMKLIRK